jgi:hypothetical protein
MVFAGDELKRRLLTGRFLSDQFGNFRINLLQ